MTLSFSELAPDNLAVSLAAQLRDMVAQGVLTRGDRLPSSRALAKQLEIARGTVITALETLVAEGILEARHGSGTFVSVACTATALLDAADAPPLGVRDAQPDVDVSSLAPINFQPCRPSLEAFPQGAWRRCMADAASAMPSSDYGDPQGELELRVAIASYLCRARGLDIEADQIIVTNGAIAAIDLVARQYLNPGDGCVFENPGYPLARQVFAGHGATMCEIGVDEEGLMTGALPRGPQRIRLAYLTPSHQFPTGSRLSLARRRKILDWACEQRVLILEDDYDGEFRYDIAPLPPMISMAPCGHVLYLGTFSKTLFPSLRIGYAAGDRRIIRRLTALRVATDYQTNSLVQRGLARFIASGQFERYVQKMRRRYAHKRQQLQRAIETVGLNAKLMGMASGLNAQLRIDAHPTATNIAHRASLQGVDIAPIGRYAGQQAVTDNALVLGYAASSDEQIQRGVETLARVMRD
ncbi:MAG: PLP-dependent aminotransferase family protein [Gammaproteobacteria bacterium]